MARRKPPGQGKTRTREHVIADLAVNHVERQVLLGDGTVERIVRDRGLELILYTYTQAGEMVNDQVFSRSKGQRGSSGRVRAAGPRSAWSGPTSSSGWLDSPRSS